MWTVQELLFEGFNVVGVDVCITKDMNEVARLEITDLHSAQVA